MSYSDLASDFVAKLRDHAGEQSHNPYLILDHRIREFHPNPKTQHLVIHDKSIKLDGFLKEKLSLDKEKLYLPGCHAWYLWEVIDKPLAEQIAARAENRPDVEHKLEMRVSDGILKFTYEGVDFLVYKATWMDKNFPGYERCIHHFVWDGEDDSAGKTLVTTVYKWMEGSPDSIWVFQQGQWTQDKGLFNAIQESSWDDVVLEKTFIDKLRRDTRTFFDSRSIYRALHVGWKRGLILIGQPGLGKTETIKLLLKDSGKIALYVKSFESTQGTEAGIRAIFEHARTSAPCILVLEDLDSLIKPEIRSFFLNELDGLENNDGILTIATTNHAEKIDDSILNRPSRFDAKYFFNYPSWNLRVEYCKKWLQKSHDVAGLNFDDTVVLAERVADKTEGWSFAFLKELFVSFLLRLAHEQSLGETTSKDPKTALLDQVEQLADQVQSGIQAVGDANVATGSGPWVRTSQAAMVRSQAPMYM